MLLTPTEARDQGFTIDRNCYPHFAYKGNRFNPTESRQCMTDKEESALLRFKNLRSGNKLAVEGVLKEENLDHIIHLLLEPSV